MNARISQFVFITILLSPIFSAAQSTQSINDHFEKIRNNEAELTAFISQMPKGGDLHNHYSGAIYAETYLNWLMDADYYLDTVTLKTATSAKTKSYLKLSYLKNRPYASFDSLKAAIIRSYSTWNYDVLHNDSREDHFFATFGNFSNASGMNTDKGFMELKTRAKAENVSYIECMFSSIWLQRPAKSTAILDNSDTIKYYNDKFIAMSGSNDVKTLEPMLQWLYQQVLQLPIDKTADDFNKTLDSLHFALHIDDADFTMRYLTYIQRTKDPLTCFINLVVAFNTVRRSKSGLLMGVNIVAPEDNVVSMRDYWLHMQMFSFCNKQFDNKIKYAMHAGELTEGYVTPEELTWHISAAVYIAGASRIGHGVDIGYEKNNYTLLNYMRSKNIAVEINLSSNEFILGVKDDRHPILLYKRFGVPIVISTDDPGISRSSLTEQYVLLAKRYKEVSYADVKSYVYNSIRYSFMNDKMKEQGIKDLDARFGKFESYIMTNKP